MIENARSNGTSFAAALKRRYHVQVAHSGKQGLALALAARPDVIVLDAVSLRTSGDRICARLRSGLGELPIIHIRPADSPNGESVADMLLTPPFTSRKLVNRIEHFAPPATGALLEVGQFVLNLEQQTLTTPWCEKKLTPKLVAMAELFLRHPNEVLERRMLMQQIWKTDYMGDTRTLDVHIRWIREVMEPTPQKPQYIKTIRGVGYRFVLPDGSESAGETAR
ncbi:MAG: response regulator transcription factor [Chloroflexi bacterium]|nr:response regulator transcription factor [Chloroflexota bacterium]